MNREIHVWPCEWLGVKFPAGRLGGRWVTAALMPILPTTRMQSLAAIGGIDLCSRDITGGVDKHRVSRATNEQLARNTKNRRPCKSQLACPGNPTLCKSS